MHRHWTYTVLLLFLLGAGLACEAGTEPGGHGAPASLAILPAADTLNVGVDSIRFTVRVTDADGQEIPGADSDVVWSTPEPGLQVSLRSDGWAVFFAHPTPLAVIATLGELADTAWVLVRQIPAGVELDPAELVLPRGARESIRPWVYDSAGHSIDSVSVDWLSTDSDVATVDAAGRVTARQEGAAWMVASIPGAMGDSAAVTVVAPEPIRFAAVDAGFNFHTCALDVEGRAYCWGRDVWGELGNGDAGSSNYPTPVETDLRFVEIIAGNRHGCARTDDGEVWCWGERDFTGTETPDICHGLSCTRTPRQVAGIPPIVSLHGTRSSCGLTADGAAWCWDDEPFEFLPGRELVSVITTEWRFCGLTAAGEVHCATRRTGSATRPSADATLEANDPSLVALTGGYSHYCALADDGDGYCWGSNGAGQLGVGHEYGRETPTLVVEDHRYRSISAGGYTWGQDVILGQTNTCAVTLEGHGYCWGLNGSGQVGIETRAIKCHVGNEHAETYCEPRPARVAEVPTFESISAGGKWACGVGGDGILYCWGYNNDGQLGIGHVELGVGGCGAHQHCALTPVPVLGQQD